MRPSTNRRPARRLLLLLGVLAIASCTRSIEPVKEHDLAGQWTPAEVPSPPSSLDFMMMLLAVRDTVVSGRGYWGDVPGPRGTLAVTGTARGTWVVLDVAYSSDLPTVAARAPQHFEGDLVTPYEMRGTLWEQGAARPFTWRKLVPID